jgi:hypothetical protein
MNSLCGDGSVAVPICGVMVGLLRSGGAGIGEGGSSSRGILFISLLRLHVWLE